LGAFALLATEGIAAHCCCVGECRDDTDDKGSTLISDVNNFPTHHRPHFLLYMIFLHRGKAARAWN
jgi:hypothetical protein